MTELSPEVDSSKFETLVERLVRGTPQRDIAWSETPRRDAFVTILEHGSVEVSRCQEFDDAGSPMEWFELIVITPNGQVVERLSSQPNLSGMDSVKFDARKLAELYRQARASATGANDVLDGILGELARSKS
jgi:hypothetical protein